MDTGAAPRSPTPRCWRFGRVTFDETSFELHLDGRPIEVERKPIEVLQVLLEHAGKVVTKSALVQQAWPGRVIGDAALAKAIARLREAIRDADHSIVRTHHRYGYRLVADVVVEHAKVSPEITGAPPALSKSARADAEHRVMTMMFCDLVDSTRLAETLEPETFRSLLLDYQRSTAEIVTRYEGHVAQQFGDGMLFYFGYPSAHDDDAERAVRCGCELLGFASRAASYTRVEMRIGIHTGPVVIGRTGTGGDIQATGVGLNVASRLQAVAEPNTVLISDTTFRLVPGLFVTRDFGLQGIRGLGDPLRVHQVLQPSGVRSRLDAQSRLTPFAGRDREIALVDASWADTVDGNGRAILFSGEPGMGKSRLLLELRSRLTRSAHTWLECRADALNRHSAFHVASELIRRGFAMGETDNDAQRLHGLERRLDDLGFDRDRIIPLLAPLLALPATERHPASTLPPETQRALTLEWLADWISRLAEEQPLVLVFEDLHWCDESTLEFIGALLARAESLPLLVVMTARPEFVASWQSTAAFTTERLEGLGRQAVERILADLSGDASIPPGLQARIVERAAGVPLFIEELVRGVQESGRFANSGTSAADVVPQSLNSLIRARLDRLGSARELIQCLSVVGMECDHIELQRVSGLDDDALRAQLEPLIESGLLLADGSGSGARYLFKHALIRDGAYTALLRNDRQALHGRVAEAIESLHAARLSDHYAALVHHCEHAGQIDRAARFARLASASAIRRSANHEAAAHLATAIRLSECLDPGPAQQRDLVALNCSLGATLTALYGYTHSGAIAAYDRAKALGMDLVDCPDLAAVLSGLATHHLMAARYGSCRELVDELERLGDQIGSNFARIYALFLRGQALYCMGRFVEAERSLVKAIAMYERERPNEVDLQFQEYVYSSSIMVLGMVLWFLGHFDRSAAEGDRGLAHARKIGHPFSIAISCNFRGYMCQKARDVAGTVKWANENIALSNTQSFAFYVSWSEILIGWTEAQSGQATQAVARIRRAMETFHGNGAEFFRSWAQMTLAEALSLAGHPGEALHSIEAALHAANATDEGAFLGEIHRLRGELMLQAGSSESDAAVCFDMAIAVARSQQARVLELRAATSLARLRWTQGRSAEAIAVLRPVYDGFTEGLSAPDLIEAGNLLAELA